MLKWATREKRDEKRKEWKRTIEIEMRSFEGVKSAKMLLFNGNWGWKVEEIIYDDDLGSFWGF
jgi:hypothetical protein